MFWVWLESDKYMREETTEAHKLLCLEVSVAGLHLPRLSEALAPESCRLPFRKSDQEHVVSAGDPTEHLDCGNLVHLFESRHRK